MKPAPPRRGPVPPGGIGSDLLRALRLPLNLVPRDEGTPPSTPSTARLKGWDKSWDKSGKKVGKKVGKKGHTWNMVGKTMGTSCETPLAMDVLRAGWFGTFG